MGKTLSQPVLIGLLICGLFFANHGGHAEEKNESTGLQVRELVSFGPQWGFPHAIDWETGLFTFHTINLCAEDKDVLCRIFRKEIYVLNKDSWSFSKISEQEILPEEFGSHGLVLENRFIDIMDSLGSDVTDGFISYRSHQLSGGFVLETEYSRQKHNLFGRAIIKQLSSGDEYIIDLRRSALTDFHVYEQSNEALFLILEAGTCGASACSGGLDIYKIKVSD